LQFSLGEANKQFRDDRKPQFADSIMSTTRDNILSGQQKFEHVMNFKDYRGFKKVENIKEKYKIGRVLGEGSFG